MERWCAKELLPGVDDFIPRQSAEKETHTQSVIVTNTLWVCHTDKQATFHRKIFSPVVACNQFNKLLPGKESGGDMGTTTLNKRNVNSADRGG